MTQFISKQDIKILMGNGPKEVSSRPMVRKQGNGNFTGFNLVSYDDGSEIEFPFVINSPSIADVQQEWLRRVA